MKTPAANVLRNFDPQITIQTVKGITTMTSAMTVQLASANLIGAWDSLHCLAGGRRIPPHPAHLPRGEDRGEGKGFLSENAPNFKCA